MGIGIFLIANPGLWSNPNHFTLGDATAGIAAAFVGVVMLCLAFVPALLRKRPRSKIERREEGTGAP